MNKLIIVVGATAVGKTKFAIDLAKKLNTEIISADSRQIYKEMIIGTASPSADELAQVRHHFVASNSIHNYYNASKYEFDAIDLIDKLFINHENVVVAGGSGLYIDAILFGIDDLPTIEPQIRDQLQQQYESEGIESIRFMLKYFDPVSYKKIDLRNSKRILKALEVFVQTGKPYSSFLTGKKKKRNFEPVIIVLNRNRKNLHERINLRVAQMMQQGLLAEAEKLYPYRNLSSLKTVGYSEIFDFLSDKIDLETAVELIKRNTRRYARRQITWFNRYENAHRFDITEPYDISQIISEIL